MKRVTALFCLLALLVPSVASAAIIQTFFPPSGQFFVEIVTSSSLDAVNHALLGIKTDNADFYFVQMDPSGTPTPGTSWLYGRIKTVHQVGPTTFDLTWDVSISTGGVNAVWVPAGTITITISV